MTTLVQGWLELDDKTVVPARSSSLELSETQLQMVFPPSREISAIAQGHRWEKSDAEFKTLFLCSAQSNTGVFRPTNAGCTIDENDLATADFQAYYTADATPDADGKIPGTPVEIVNEITGKRQIILKAGGKAELSSDLIGRNLKLRVIYRGFVQCGQAIESITARVIHRNEEANFFLSTYAGCKVVPSDHIYRVCLDISNAIVDTQSIDLSASP